MSGNKWFLIFLFSIIAIGCAQPMKNWVITPEEQYFDRSNYDIKIIPQKVDSPTYRSFLLELSNKSQDTIQIDWNKSIYVYKRKNAGRLVFKGIDPAQVKESTVPPDLVNPGQTLTKEIGPYKLIAFEVAKYRNQPDKPSISFGMLPEGENGILLILRLAGEEIRERFLFKISSNEL